MKTNNKWYPVEKHGNYYKLIDGFLMAVPMLRGGGMDMDGNEPNILEVTEFEDTDDVIEMLKNNE